MASHRQLRTRRDRHNVRAQDVAIALGARIGFDAPTSVRRLAGALSRWEKYGVPLPHGLTAEDVASALDAIIGQPA